MTKVLKEQIAAMDMLCDDVFKMTIHSEYVAENAKPGQFINIKCGGLDTLLRRPISICDVDRAKSTFDIVFQVKGKGTESLCQRCSVEVDIIAPLGNPFTLDEKYKNVCVVGGGIGTFPLLYLLHNIQGAEKTALLGYRNKAAVTLENPFRAAAQKVQIATDDGSYGARAFVTELLTQNIEAGQKPDIIYTCGPTPMMRRVAAIAESHGIPCQVSMEQRMGCGIGACLVCACKTKKDDDWQYSHVCKDGPVFWSQDVCWE